MTKLISVADFRKELQAKRKPTDGVFRVSAVQPKVLDDATRMVRFCFSDGSVDRMGDTIDPSGWDLADFNANPVALWAHDSYSPPIGRASEVNVEGPRLMGTVEFAPPETYAFADTVYRLVVGKFVNAVSVGFLPLEYSFVDNDPKRGFGIDFKRQELLEISVCPVPANPNALAEARAKGIDTRPVVEWAERCLDGTDKAVLSRAELEQLRRAAKEPRMVRRTPNSRRRAEGEEPQEPEPEEKPKGNCGRPKDQECGMKAVGECAVHGAKAEGEDEDPKPDDDQDKAILRALRRLLAGAVRRQGSDEPDGDELPMEHHDAIRIAHKSMRTCKSFLTEAMGHYGKAMDLLDGVVESLDSDGSDQPDGNGNGDKPPDDAEKAAQIARARAIRDRLRQVA
jgi:HK97 family phage prohead protease